MFTQGANADAAKEAGADIVGFEDLAAEIKAIASSIAYSLLASTEERRAFKRLDTLAIIQHLHIQAH